VKTVKEWLPDWAANLEDTSAVGHLPLNAEVETAAQAIALVNQRIDLMMRWWDGFRPADNNWLAGE
jgi:hypothetical protein